MPKGECTGGHDAKNDDTRNWICKILLYREKDDISTVVKVNKTSFLGYSETVFDKRVSCETIYTNSS